MLPYSDDTDGQETTEDTQTSILCHGKASSLPVLLSLESQEIADSGTY